MSDQKWLNSLAGYGLPGASLPTGLPALVSDLVSASSTHKLTGVLAAAVGDGVISLPPDDYSEVARAHEGAMREALLLEEMLLQAVAVLDTAGIESRVLKGSALAHMVHPDPAERCFGDNDVLVGSRDIDAALAALEGAGALRAMPPLSASYDRRFAKSVTLRWTGRTELDLHRTLAAGPFGYLIDLDDLMLDPVEVLLAGRVVQTLPADVHLLHGAIHVALGDVDARLGNVRDLALLARRESVDVDKAVTMANRWQCAAPIALGLRRTAALGHTRTEIEKWADEYVVTERDQRRLDAYSQTAGRFRRQAIASWQVLDWRDRIAFSRALLVPNGANRVARGRTRRSQFARVRPD